MSQTPAPREFTTGAGIRAWITAQRAGGSRIGFVPTMGYLHEGHLALVDAARAVSDVVVMSIFVNPLQFGPSEDLSRYPRDLPRDRQLAASRGVDALFLPDVSVMYPPGSVTRVVPGPGADRWEGEVRPGHFTGVLTVVAKLFHLVTPDVAVFGQKDAQQAALIRQMVRDLDWPVALVVAPTTREPDGLALSSRNTYLSAEDRRQAVGLSAALRAAHEAWRGGETAGHRLVAVARQVLEVYPGVSPEYISTVEPEALAPVETVGAGCLMLIAARVGSTRLIDNTVFGEGIP
ncbi:MAG: pantoate--beta-alanine ligase [Gemmatimonadales bacterium]